MVKIAFFAALMAIIAFAHSPLDAQERARLAVFPALIADSARPSFGEAKLDAQELTQQIEEALRATRRFAIFERSAKILQNSVLLEQEFANWNSLKAGKRSIMRPKLVNWPMFNSSRSQS